MLKMLKNIRSDKSPKRMLSNNELLANEMASGRLSGYIGDGTTLSGETNFQGVLRIDGQLAGRVFSESGTLIIGATGRVDANISVASAVINGVVNGDIEGVQCIKLGHTARVVGNIQSPRMVMEDGAIYEGNCSMLRSKEAFEKKLEEIETNAQRSEYAENRLPAIQNIETYETYLEELAKSAVN